MKKTRRTEVDVNIHYVLGTEYNEEINLRMKIRDYRSCIQVIQLKDPAKQTPFIIFSGVDNLGELAEYCICRENIVCVNSSIPEDFVES